MEDLSVQDQILKFYYSDIILTPHGTGLINIVFSIPHSCVIECYPPYFYENWFINTACQSITHYITIFTRATNVSTELYKMAENAYNQGSFLDLHSSIKNKIKDYDFNPTTNQILNAVSDAIEYCKRWKYVYEVTNKFSPFFYLFVL